MEPATFWTVRSEYQIFRPFSTITRQSVHYSFSEISADFLCMQSCSEHVEALSELGLNSDKQTVRQRGCLITEIPPLREGNQTVCSCESTAPMLAAVWFHCCTFAL